MVFNSIAFAIFIVIVYSLYILLNHKWQNRLLLVASYVFYGSWDWRFLSLIWASTVLDYFCGIKIHEARHEKKRRLFLFLSIFGNLAMLGVFKYFDFFAGTLQDLLGFFGLSIHPRFINVILPVGISFYTFQTMSYTIDIYRGQIRPTKRFLDFALFVSFFPQLVAGPIERAKNLLPQVLNPRKLTLENFYLGSRLILWGLFKKIVIADRLAIYVDTIYGNVYNHSSMSFVVATIFFGFQIYCDFSAYSDIARGLAKQLGFDIMINFKNPYFSKDIREFWQRWHISLSTWLRDYLYIPLGGNRKGPLMTYRNIFITMLLGGLWHGANWTFIVWGALHATYIVITRIVEKKLSIVFMGKTIENFFTQTIKTITTFTIVSLAWIFFRASNLSEAFYIIKSIFSPDFRLFLGAQQILYGVMGIFALLLFEVISYKKITYDVLWFKSTRVRWIVYYLIIFGIILFGIQDGEQFIYFQF